MKYKNRKDAKRKYKQAILATVATMTVGLSTVGGTAPVFAAVQPVQELPKTFLNDLGLEFNPPSIQSAEVKKIMIDASENPRRLNDLLRQISMGVTGKVPAVGSVVSALVGYLYPEQNGVDSKLNALEDKLTAKIEKTADAEHVKIIKSKIQTLTEAADELQVALNKVNKGIYYDGSVQDIHSTLRKKAEAVDNNFKALIPFLTQEGHEIGDLPVYTKVAAAHIMFLNYMKTRGTDSKLYRYDTSSTVDAQFQPANRVSTYAKHIEDTFKKGDAAIVKLIEKRDELISEKRKLIVPGIPVNIGTEAKIHTLDNQIEGLNTLHLEEKRSLYRDLTVAEGSFEAASGRKLTYTNFDDILNGTYKIVSKLDPSMVLDNDYGHHRLAKLNKYYDTADGEPWTLKYNKTKKAYKIISKHDSDELAISGARDSNLVFATTDRRDNDERYWILEDAGNGYFFIKNLANGKVLDVTDGKTDIGTDIKQHVKNSSPVAAQMFKFERLN
ncbi:RICIN domain-containing protein [Bacillus cereus]|uniref:RICIN domain-containing protein n=1 Tax=Bacillus cereus TaxID=1396 RepID=UPI001E5EA56B|nr:RICIN domain-containing protein [Bacillus cereus]MCD2338378.1 RICIN domain-containing protein [Bacillus cereus]